MRVARVRTTAVVASPAGAAETIVASISPAAIPPGQTGDPVDLIGHVDIGPVGTSGVSVTVSVRRGQTTAGQLLATVGPITVSAASRYAIPIHANDNETNTGYVMTVTVASAAAASTVNNCTLRADW